LRQCVERNHWTLDTLRREPILGLANIAYSHASECKAGHAITQAPCHGAADRSETGDRDAG